MLEGKCTTSLVHRKDVNFCNNVSKFYSNILHARNFPFHCGFYQKCNSIPILSNRNSIMIRFYINVIPLRLNRKVEIFNPLVLTDQFLWCDM